VQDLDQILSGLAANVDGALAVAVSGMDGLLVEQHAPQGRDLTVLAAEMTNVLQGARHAFTLALDGGALKEVIITAEQSIGYTRLLGADLFCLILLSPGGNIGKARLYSDQAAKHILEVLV
jgi:predicted regulator of Ras-like GTPase activity (Roadblock/LC7/MglB family)